MSCTSYLPPRTSAALELAAGRSQEVEARVALRLGLVDAVVEAEEVDALGEGGAAADEASLGRGLDVGVLLAGGDLDLAGDGSLGDDVHGADGGHCGGWMCVGEGGGCGREWREPPLGRV